MQGCLLLGNQAGKRLILNTGSCSLAANWSIQEGGSYLWPRTSFCFSPLGAPDRAGASHGPSRQKAQSALEVVRPLDRSIAQAKPLLSKQIQLQCSCCCSEQPGWELEYQLGQGAQLHSSSLPLFAIAATLPGAFRAGALLPGALLPSPWQ